MYIVTLQAGANMNNAAYEPENTVKIGPSLLAVINVVEINVYNITLIINTWETDKLGATVGDDVLLLGE